MRCDWQERGDRVNGVGSVECSRCGRIIYSTPNTAEEIRGDYSCLTWPRWWEIGSWLAYALALIGLRKEAWQMLFGACGCSQRETALNRLGSDTIVGLTDAYRKSRAMCWR